MLNNYINMLNKQWNYVDFRNYNNRYIPKTSGIYLFARAKKRILQVPIGLEIIYIGKSKNLKNRFKHYSNYREFREQRKVHNKNLGNFIKSEDNLEFWYLETELSEISTYEALLTKELDKFNQNLTNKIKFKTLKGELYV